MSVRQRAKQKGARKSGWLSKRGGRIHTWHRRWFVLTGDILFYYKNPQDSRPTGTIPLAGNKVVRHPDDHKQPNSYKFEIIAGNEGQVITSTHDTYPISAESAEDADSWVAAINGVMCEPYGGGMFGRSLDETMQVEGRLGGTYIPIILYRCVRFIREHDGLNEVGLFRLPGQTSRVQYLKNQYNQGLQEDLPPNEDVHTVASLFKLFLRELPEPVIPYVYYDSFQKATTLYKNNQVEAVDELKRLLIQIPKAHFNVFKYVCRFLNEVQEHQDVNRMSPMNLGTIFGPHLLRPQTDDPQVLMESNNLSARFVCVLVHNLLEFFPLTSDEKPPKRLSIVMPLDILQLDNFPLVWQENKLISHSLYESKPRGDTRQRQNSVPSCAFDTRPRSNSKVATIVEQYNMRSSISAGSMLQQQASKSLEFPSTVVISQPQRPTSSPAATALLTKSTSSPIVDLTANSGVQFTSIYMPKSPVLGQNGVARQQNGLSKDQSEDEDEEVPEMLKRFSGLQSGVRRQQSDTLSSDVIVNSISKELDTYEKQLALVKEELTKYKKAARLWKSRYEQERRARLAAEDQIGDLQGLIDETFKQFALDDSDDCFEEDSNDACSSLYTLDSDGLSTPELAKPLRVPPSRGSTLPPSQAGTLPPSRGSTLPPSQTVILPPSRGGTLPPSQPAILPPSRGCTSPPPQTVILPPSRSNTSSPTQTDSTLPPSRSNTASPTQTDSTLPPSHNGTLPSSRGGTLPPSRNGALPSSRSGTVPRPILPSVESVV